MESGSNQREQSGVTANAVWPTWGACAVAPGITSAPPEMPPCGAGRRFVLKHIDQTLAVFAVEGDACVLLDVSDALTYLCPLGMALTGLGLRDWLAARLGTSDLRQALMATHALSLFDCHWVMPEHFGGAFRDFNLIENGSGWHGRFFVQRSDGQASLLSRDNVSRDVCRAELAASAGLDAVPCERIAWRGESWSRRPLFTDLEHSYVPLAQCFPGKSLEAIARLLRRMGVQFWEPFQARMAFEARSGLGNWDTMGLMVDNRTNKPVAWAPLW